MRRSPLLSIAAFALVSALAGSCVSRVHPLMPSDRGAPGAPEGGASLPVAAVCPEARGPVLRGITQIHASSAITCAVVHGDVACWGVEREGRLGSGPDRKRLERPAFVEGIHDVVEVSHGVDATFARTQDGSMWVWGSNRMGDFGDGSPDYHVAWTPRKLPDWGRVRAIRGHIPTCALSEKGEVLCAGRPRFRSMREDPMAPGGKATPMFGYHDVVDLAAGGGFTCVLLADGHVECWGMDDSGQLGDGGGDDRAAPVRVRGIRGATSIAAGVDTACALLSDRTVRCWGVSLGGGEIGEPRPKWESPVAIHGAEGAVEIAVSDRVACARMGDGTVRCWGDASYDGQLGDGTAGVRPTEAKPVRCVEGAVQITVGDNHSCALLRDGTAKCWGSHDYGALGNGETEIAKIPTFVAGAEKPGPPPDRCEPGTVLRQGPGDDPKHEPMAEWCEKPDGTRNGLYRGRWASGSRMREGQFSNGKKEGAWQEFYEHGELLSDDLYVGGQPNGIWVAYSLHRIFAFATCFDHGKRVWQVADEREANHRTCP